MSLTDEQQDQIYRQSFKLIDSKLVPEQRAFCRAIESAATAPLLERIKGLLQKVAKGADVEAEQRSRIADLERQLEQAGKDAERYRWLRSVPNGFKAMSIVNDTPEGMDAAIDAAIKESK